MLISMKELQRYKILAEDGQIGKVYEFYFDDEIWLIRYLVVDTGNWLPGRKVLIPPAVLDHPDEENKILPVKLVKEQIKNSPDIDTDRPISLQNEVDLHDEYAQPYLDQLGGGLFEEEHFGMRPESIVEMINAKQMHQDTALKTKTTDLHLQSSREVIGYHIKAEDGEIGHIADFILSDETWVIRYMVVDTGSWLSGQMVLISPFWLKEIEWSGSVAHVDLTREALKNSPEYDASKPIRREYEKKLFDYYDQPDYWS